jgi:predicted phosphatase
MKTIRARPLPVDIDETLVMHHDPYSYSSHIEVEDPEHSGQFIALGVNEPMVKILKDEKIRGAFVFVWSRSGSAWAEAVIKALNLEKYVDLVMTKPVTYLDDKDSSEWLKDRVYLHPKTTYKKHQLTPLTKETK